MSGEITAWDLRNSRKENTIMFTQLEFFALASIGEGYLGFSELVTPEGIGPSSPA